MVGSFYDPNLEEGCAFEELISFHGGLGGPQTRPFILSPVDLPLPAGDIVGAASVHGVLSGWRQLLQGGGGAGAGAAAASDESRSGRRSSSSWPPRSRWP